MKKRDAISIILLLSVLIIPMISAELFISQPKTLYNYGDELTISITLNPIVETNSFLTANLICSNESVMIYRAPVHLQANEKREIAISIKLDPEVIGKVKGNCGISASYSGESSSSQSFELTSLINLEINNDYNSYNPQDNTQITGQATKANGMPLEGYIELTSNNVEIRAGGIVESGKFSLNISIPSNTPAGNIQLTLNAYEKDNSNNIANQGNATTILKINQVPTTFSIALENEEFIPGESIIIKPILLDQTNNPLEKSVQIDIYSPKSEKTLSKSILTNQEIIITSEYNSSPGYWKISGISEGLTATRQITITELKNLSFKLMNNTFLVYNKGNVPYIGEINVKIAEKEETLELNLNVNGFKEFKLKAPKGEYDIAVNNGLENIPVGRTYLTGRTVDIQTRGEEIRTTAKIISWLLVIIALIIIVIHYYKKLNLGSSITRIPQRFMQFKAPENNKELTKTISGEKRQAAIISLKVKNLSEIEKKKGKSFFALEEVLSRARNAGAKITASENERLIVLPLGKENQRESMLKAFSMAQNIKRVLENANNDTYYKIEYGIGIHVSELLEEKEGNYSQLDNSFGVAKRISASADNEILCSEQAQKRVIGSIKAEKVQDKNAWKVLNIPKRGLTRELLRDKFRKN